MRTATQLSYIGHIEALLKLPCDVNNGNGFVNTLLLVVPETEYSKKVPIIIEINVFRDCHKICVDSVESHWLHQQDLPNVGKLTFHRTDAAVNVDIKIDNGINAQINQTVVIPEEQQSFNIIICSLTSAHVLAFADFNKQFILHTDASTKGLGAVLYQEQDGVS